MTRPLGCLLVAAFIVSCSPLAPSVECQGPGVLTLDECDRAIEVARDTLPSGHAPITLISVSAGCPSWMSCAAPIAMRQLVVVFYYEAAPESYVSVNRVDWSARLLQTPGPEPAQ